MKDACLATSDLFSNKVNVHLNVFSALMMYWITRKVNGTNIITIHQSSQREWKVKLQEKIAKPTRFRYHISSTPVLGFCTRARECGLSLGRPGNEVVTKKHTIAGDRTAGARTSTPISISIRNKFLNRGLIEMQTIV